MLSFSARPHRADELKNLRPLNCFTLYRLLQVKDPDNKNGITQTHTCSLENSQSGDEDAFFISISNQRNLLRVKANRILNFEEKKIYNITVTCSDRAFGISKSLLIHIIGKLADLIRAKGLELAKE